MRSDCTESKYISTFTQPLKKIELIIISGQKLKPFNYESNVTDIVDPYVEVSIKGVPLDTKRNKPKKTKVIDDNGFNPIWNMPCQTQQV